MNEKIKTAILFSTGICICYLAISFYVKKRKKAISAEIVLDEKKNDEKTESFVPRKKDYVEYSSILKKEGYSTVPPEIICPEKPANKEDSEKPYLISPDDFGSLDNFDTIGLIYYADHFLADEDGEMVENVDNVIGFDALNHFGEYDEDAVYVRNERLKCDYEILKDEKKYSDLRRKLVERTGENDGSSTE